MKTFSKMVLTGLVAITLGAGAASAEQVVRRIDHPNGPATYVSGARERAPRIPTIGVYAGDVHVSVGDSQHYRSGVVRMSPGANDSEGRTVIPIHRGRGEVTYVRVQQ